MFHRIIQGIKRRVANFIATNSSYHFLVRNWEHINDIELIVKVLGTEFFKDELRPVELPLYKRQKILVIAPHQDDEAIGAGGMLLKASKIGAKIHILYATNGSQPSIGYSLKTSVEVRNNEAKKVCEMIGAEMHHLSISNHQPDPSIDHLNKFSDIIIRFHPDIILIPWLLDNPVKHRMVNHLLALSDQINVLPDCEVWGYQVHNTLYPNGYIDITDVIEEKKQMLTFYESQNKNIQCYDHLSIGMSAWNARFMPIKKKKQGIIEKKYGETFFTLPKHVYINLIHKYYLLDLNKTYKGNTQVINAVTKLIKEIKGLGL